MDDATAYAAVTTAEEATSDWPQIAVGEAPPESIPGAAEHETLAAHDAVIRDVAPADHHPAPYGEKLAQDIAVATADPQPESEREDERTYGSFWLGDAEFLLPAAHVREVVPFPTSRARVPLCPNYVVGVFDLRGEMIPIVCVATLLGLECPSLEPEVSRVAIVDCGKDRIGALFARTGEVLRLADEDLREIHHRADEANPVVSGLLSMDGGARILQLLSAELIAQVDHIPRGQRREADTEEQLVPKSRWVAFCVGSVCLAIRSESVTEIQETPMLQPTTASFSHSAGVVSLRGETVRVLDLHGALGLGERDPDKGKRLLFVHNDETECALLVDNILDVFATDDDALHDVPMLSRLSTGKLCHQVVAREDREHLLALDIGALFSAVDLRNSGNETGGSRAHLQPPSDQHGDGSERMSFVAFRLGDQRFAFPIGAVREIQEFPNELLTPPGKTDVFIGMMRLRGTMLCLVDMRSGYGISSDVAVEDSKVLVLDAEPPVGLVVDNLDGIVHSDAEALVAVQSCMISRTAETEPFRDHLAHAVPLPEGGSVLTLDPTAVTKLF